MDDELVQEIRPLETGQGAGPHGRGRLAVIGWAVVLVAAVAIGLTGPQAPGNGESSAADGTRAVPTPPDARFTTPTDDPGRTPRPISVAILEPAATDDAITTPRLTVRGYIAAPVRYVDVRLESRSQHTLEKYSYRPDVAPIAGRPVSFGTEFDLPALRPNGTMWVTVVGFNERGIPVDATRRRIDIGELLEGDPRPRRAPGVRPTGQSAGYAV